LTYLATPPAPGRYAWRQQLCDLAEFHGWHARMLAADWEPDMLLIRRPRLLWVFAEPNRGRLSGPRFTAFCELRACRQDAVVWRADRLEQVMRVLT
jgi:hypothetical protein